jgi:mannose-6-phosphate isomerase-like protein (cupin superfamily)
MTKYLYTRDKAYKFSPHSGIDGYSYISAEDFPRASVSYVDADGDHPLTTCPDNDLSYYVLSGQGTFIIGTEIIQAKETDVILIPRATSFSYTGKMKLVEFMNPAFGMSDNI